MTTLPKPTIGHLLELLRPRSVCVMCVFLLLDEREWIRHHVTRAAKSSSTTIAKLSRESVLPHETGHPPPSEARTRGRNSLESCHNIRVAHGCQNARRRAILRSMVTPRRWGLRG